ncbi:MAG: imidazole glycerol phosphate synthase subunit HisH [Planctomycetota bacterium]
MNDATVAIVATGIANVASVAAAFSRLGVASRLVESADAVRTADRVVLPGVGAFGAGMERLRATGLGGALAERIEAGRATLAVCLGMQLLFGASDESPGVRGLSLVPGHVRRFGDGVRVPQFGWNRVEVPRDARVLESGHAYFANSYRVREAPAGWTVSLATHGEPFIAAMERGRVLACQFHPELSGTWGLALMRRWLEFDKMGGSATC